MWTVLCTSVSSTCILVTLNGIAIDPLQPNISVHILHTVAFNISNGSNKENLFNNQGLLKLVIIFFILMSVVFDVRVVTWGEIGS